MADVFDGRQFRDAARLGLRRRRAPADLVMRQGDMRNVRVAARHVTGGAAVRGILLAARGRLQRAGLLGVTAQADLPVEGAGVLWFLARVRIVASHASEVDGLLVAGA